ncbi:hypothetical protein PVAND_010281 [Polypedilum vanderplanki]|uniref:Probable ATP-dependent RNA helicase spindle-E n=1 Tax=Polypedilum vanderplanki TaxID=319348 RepID=A0A9J6CG75_POLVA|nr:hypothetical protein PVAND_010281 [Polypedilum vanderplanki]
MVSDNDEASIDAFFLGKIVRKRKAEPNFKTEPIEIKKKVIDYKRDILEPSTSDHENNLLTKFLNTPVEEIQRECTLGIEEEEEKDVKVFELPRNLQIYARYEFNLPKQDLPIKSKHDEILKTINDKKISIIKASTGSGKSTQVPQYILENAYRKKLYCNIIITQPRRISTQMLAERVALERKCEVGSLVGYQIGLDKKMDSDETRILYCTTGVFLQKLVNKKSVKEWTHVIIDEIHERDISMDLVLTILRRIMVAHNPDVKIILMSATLNCEKISNYFKIVHLVPVLNLDVKRTYQMKIQYLNDLSHLGANETYIDIENPTILPQMYTIGAKLIDLLIQKGNKTFLVFLPGIHEIDFFERELRNISKNLNTQNFSIIILHSSIPTKNFPELHDTEVRNKIILATNIAESSVTIKDVGFVIDYCLTKYIELERDTNLTQLRLSWASKMNLIQRAGRTGRTQNGQVVRMIYEHHYQQLDDEPRPEMKRMPLENVILKAKELDMGTVCDLLAISLDPPKRSAIIEGILSLKANFALSRYMNGEFNFIDGNMTLVGRIMNKLPIDIRLSKLIIFGHVFSVFNEAVIIAAGLSVRSIFISTRYHTQMSAYETKLRYDPTSDCIALLKVYEKYQDWKTKQNRKIPYGVEVDWCNRHMVDIKNLKDMQKQIEDIYKRLHEFKMSYDFYRFQSSDEKIMVIKMIIAGAFYPNVFTFGGNIPGREDFKIMNDKNMYSTVYFKSFDRTNHGYLYKNQILNLLCEKEVISTQSAATVMFDGNSKRVFVDLNSAVNNVSKIKMPGDVMLEVYKAVKLRKLFRREDLTIKVLDQYEESAYKELYSLKTTVDRELKIKDKFNIYPNDLAKQNDSLDFLCGSITNIISPSKFYFQPNKGKDLLKKLMEKLKDNLDMVTKFNDGVPKNKKIMVSYKNEYMRAHIINQDDDQKYKALLIDFGLIISCTINDLYTASADTKENRMELLNHFFEIPQLCYECKLAKVQPTPLQQYGWSQSATQYFKDLIKDQNIEIDLYAFNHHDKIASVEVIIRDSDPKVQLKYASRLLVSLGYAKTSNESYVTTFNRYNCSNMSFMRYDMLREYKDVEISKSLLKYVIKLDGPYSPLENRNLVSIYRNQETDFVLESSSVNNILFDQYPYDGVQKVLIAASKSKNEKGNVTLRQLTLMPHLIGMANLISLIFSAYAEIRFDKKKTRCTSILAGLGCDFMGKPYFGEQDCFIRTNVEIDNEDFQMINDLRKQVSYILQNLTFNENMSRNNACYLLLKILKKERLQLPVTYSNSKVDTDNWNKKKDEGYPTQEQMFSNHQLQKLEKISCDTVKEMNRHIQDLDLKATHVVNKQDIQCKLCEEEISSFDLKIHLKNSMHENLKKKYQNLQIQNNLCDSYPNMK